ncbi:MAG: hypothetical protein WB586_03645 [Chthoniobacterales bacterium]
MHFKMTVEIKVFDFNLFRGRPGTTVMAMMVNPNAGASAPDRFRDEGLYAFRFDQSIRPDAFQNRKNFFAKHNVSAIVLEVPSHLIGQGLVHS